jgi:hypothetical protein
MQLFAEGQLYQFLQEKIARLRAEVQSQDRNYLLNANETQLVMYFVERNKLDNLVLNIENIFVSDREEGVAVGHFPYGSRVTPGKTYPKQIVTYNVSFSGDPQLLRLAPSSGLLGGRQVSIEGNLICFDIINWRDDASEITRNAEAYLKYLRTNAENVSKEVAVYNASLEAEVSAFIQQRKAEIRKKSNVLASLGIPVKSSTDVPSTFSVPPPKKKVIVSKPPGSSASFVPEPMLDTIVYHEILKIIHDTGVEIERHPGIYQGKDEETLRDHLLMVLSPHFSSVTGETFNRAGKTDILIRHEGKNVFVAECGIWKGSKQFLGKIDQLLSYLTWRDSKTALVSFVRNKEFGVVLQTINEATPTHPCFVKGEGTNGEAWFNYEFTLKDDPSRSVRLAVLCFHFPDGP